MRMKKVVTIGEIVVLSGQDLFSDAQGAPPGGQIGRFVQE